MKKVYVGFLAIFLFSSSFGPAMAWHDRTHIAVGDAAGFDLAYNLAAPDVARLKAYHVEDYNHWVNNEEKDDITPTTIRGQIQKYNLGTREEEKGHLYGAIVAAVRAYRDESGAGKYAASHLVYTGHYIGDLSMPLHNIADDSFNRGHHALNDGIVECEIRNNLHKVVLYSISIKNEDDLIQNIARIARKAKDLGYSLRKRIGICQKRKRMGNCPIQQACSRPYSNMSVILKARRPDE